MSNEENKNAYDSVDTEKLSEKMSEAMLKLLKGECEEGQAFYSHIKKNFTENEGYYIIAVHIAQMTKTMLEKNPMVAMMASMLRHTTNTVNEREGEEILKKFKDLLKYGK